MSCLPVVGKYIAVYYINLGLEPAQPFENELTFLDPCFSTFSHPQISHLHHVWTAQYFRIWSIARKLEEKNRPSRIESSMAERGEGEKEVLNVYVCCEAPLIFLSLGLKGNINLEAIFSRRPSSGFMSWEAAGLISQHNIAHRAFIIPHRRPGWVTAPCGC